MTYCLIFICFWADTFRIEDQYNMHYQNLLLCTELFHIPPKIKIWTAAIFLNFNVKRHCLRTSQCIVLHENFKNYQNACFSKNSRYKVKKNLSYWIGLSTMQFLSVEKGCLVAILFVNIIISSKGDAINSDVIKTQCWKFRESTVRRWNTFLLLIKVWNKQINSKNFMKTMLNHRKLCKAISKYITKKLLQLYIVLNLFFWRSCPCKLG